MYTVLGIGVVNATDNEAIKPIFGSSTTIPPDLSFQPPLNIAISCFPKTISPNSSKPVTSVLTAAGIPSAGVNVTVLLTIVFLKNRILFLPLPTSSSTGVCGTIVVCVVV